MRRRHWVDGPAARKQGPNFTRFAAAMDEARERGAPQLALYGAASDAFADPPAARSRRRTALRWLGIGSCVLVVCGLLVGWLVWPQPAELVNRWLAAELGGAAARSESVPVRSPTAVEPPGLAS